MAKYTIIVESNFGRKTIGMENRNFNKRQTADKAYAALCAEYALCEEGAVNTVTLYEVTGTWLQEVATATFFDKETMFENSPEDEREYYREQFLRRSCK
jgi:hypothetical protein